MLKFFVKNPVTTVMFVLFWVALGLVAFPRMNIESSPPMDFPFVTATFVYPGAMPDEIESQILERAEDAISEVPGVKKITSYGYENSGFIITEFNLGVDANEKSSEVKSKMDALANDCPDDMDKHVVEKLDPLAEPVLDIVISGADPKLAEQFVDDVLSQKITAVPGVASATVFGGQKRAVRIFIDPDRMAARGASILDIVSSVASHNLNIPGGKLEQGANANAVRFIGEFANVDEIADMRISTAEGGIFPLSDIANVRDDALDQDTGARYDGENVAIISVAKSSDGNAIKISEMVRKNMPEYVRVMDEYFAPHGEAPTMQIISDTSTAIAVETDDTVNGIILGVLLTVLTLFIFTRNWRSTIIAAVVIPASLVGGFFFMDASGFSINGMTLLACATALGTLIANAIVLIESALGLLARGMPPRDAAIQGTKNMIVPILAATGTNLVVFLPIAFMGGIAGQFMQQFGMTVVYLTILSLMFSISLTPMMIAKILRKREPKAESRKPDSVHGSRLSALGWFSKYFNYQLTHPWRVVGASVVVLILTMLPLRWVGNEFAPSTDVDEITIQAIAPMGGTYAESERIAKMIESRLENFQEVDFVSVKIGERGAQNIAIKVGLIPQSERISDKELAQKFVPALADVPGATIAVRAGRPMGSSATADLVLNVNGPDDATREKYADDILEMVNQIGEVSGARLAAPVPADEYRFIPDTDSMKFWGVSNATAATALRTALYGNDDYEYKEGGNEYPISIEFGKEYKSPEMWKNIFIPTQKGLVPLSELGEIVRAAASPEILRIDKTRVTEIDITLGKSTIGPVQMKIQNEIDKMDWRPGYSATFGGMSEMQDESTGEMASAFLLATVLTFMLLAAIMNSLAHPFTVATSILFSFAGVFVMLFLTGASINIAAMLSVIMLVGLAVNNNIILLEPTIERIRGGENIGPALWAEFNDKWRMLLMTTLAVAAGMIPQLWSADGAKLSMGAVIIGGMCASLFWTFAMTPAMFVIMERARTWKLIKKN
ncbi:MAG: efflux RND transporter permease subunit [Rickettsiales bacterium]|jgi:HAE1 family hydrophobic/amphiphilic exporter-1|nr:efflux RND transporter permease subunit [Rickettsiales bacterium]